MQRMGNIDDAVPFFGKGFNKIYPLIMVIYTLLVACNFFDHVIDYFGRWIKIKFQNEEEDMDGYDPSGVIILQKGKCPFSESCKVFILSPERSWLEQGHKVGELIIPLARIFYSTNEDVESASELPEEDKQKVAADIPSKEVRKGSQPVAPKEQETVTNKPPRLESKEKSKSHDSLLLLDEVNAQMQSRNSGAGPSMRGVSDAWVSMKNGFQKFKIKIEQKRFVPLPKDQETLPRTASSSELLDDIFEKLKQKPTRSPAVGLDFDDRDNDILPKAAR